MTSASCRLCGGTGATPVLPAGPYSLLRCGQCGLVRTEGIGTAPTAHYDAGYYSAHVLADNRRTRATSSAAGLRARLMDRAYAAYLAPSSSVGRRVLFSPVRNRLSGLPPRRSAGCDLLDVGCGDGDFLFRARSHGFHAVGQEINAAAVASAQAAGLEVYLGELDTAPFPARSFDIVRLWHVLEHVEDPVATLRCCRRLLRPGGSLIVGVPDFDSPARRLFGGQWSGLQLPFHLHHFTRGTLRRTLETAGFPRPSIRHRSVGTLFSSLTERRRNRALSNPAVWGALLLVDDVLDLAGRGDALEAVGRPA